LDNSSGVVTCAELAMWRTASWLGGCQPWGTLLLLAETGSELVYRHDYFTSLPVGELGKLEQRLLAVLRSAGQPLPPKQIAADLPEHLVAAVLDRHPEVDATSDGRFFLFPQGAKPLFASVASLSPAEAALRYNEQVAAHSRRKPSELLRAMRRLSALAETAECEKHHRHCGDKS
ncbi:MAG: hypothetical protein N3B01_09635, partial [Verrucomicrobiae bacterium]|nr:hypothetical protein [Verrucomicrobiae bacterium]